MTAALDDYMHLSQLPGAHVSARQDAAMLARPRRDTCTAD